MFGHEDKFLTNMSGMHPPRAFRFTLSSNPTTIRVANMVESQPWSNQGSPCTCALQLLPFLRCIYAYILAQVMDVAQALSNLIGMPIVDHTLALPGPSTLTYEYLLELVSTLTYNPPSRAPVIPKQVALALARAAQRIWWPALSPDEVERRYIDDADTPGDWAVVGVEPDEIENHAITYVRRYRSACVLSANRLAGGASSLCFLFNSFLSHRPAYPFLS